MKLYIYDHCPYCVKARMIFGFKKRSIKLICLSNEDEKTPISMIGVKMVPILEIKKGDFMPESMDIVSYIDKLDPPPAVSFKEDKWLSIWLAANSQLCYQLAMPRWIKAPLEEFQTQKARDYFQNKKEAYIGSFREQLEESASLIEEMKEQLQELEKHLQKDHEFFSGNLSSNDFHLFAFLRSLSIVKGLSFPDKTHRYVERLSKLSNIPLHHSIAL